MLMWRLPLRKWVRSTCAFGRQHNSTGVRSQDTWTLGKHSEVQGRKGFEPLKFQNAHTGARSCERRRPLSNERLPARSCCTGVVIVVERLISAKHSDRLGSTAPCFSSAVSFLSLYLSRLNDRMCYALFRDSADLYPILQTILQTCVRFCRPVSDSADLCLKRSPLLCSLPAWT
jgi:hypothetical protein